MCVLYLLEVKLLLKLDSLIIYVIRFTAMHYPPQWECTLCEKRYTARKPLIAHVKKNHGVSGEKFLRRVGKDDPADLAELKGLL